MQLRHISLKQLGFKLLVIGEGIVLAVCVLFLSYSKFALAACSLPGTTYGTDTMSVSVPEANTYSIWLRIQSPSSSSNEIMLQVDGGSCYTMDGSSGIPTNSWTWINYQSGSTSNIAEATLSQGNHSFELIGTESGLEVDRLELLSDQTCIPTGTGDNCTTTVNTPTSCPSGQTGTPPNCTFTPTPTQNGSKPNTSSSSSSKSSYGSSGGATSRTSTNKSTSTIIPSSSPVEVTTPVIASPVISDDSAVTKVEYFLNSKLLASVSSPPFTYRLNTTAILNGTYTFTTKTYYTNGTTQAVSQELVVKNPESLTQVRLAAQKHVPVIIICIIIIAVIIFLFFHLNFIKRNRKTPKDQPPTNNISTNINDPMQPNIPSVVSPSQTYQIDHSTNLSDTSASGNVYPPNDDYKN